METNKLIVDSGFGSYLKGERPKAIANEFLYYNPSLLLLIDEMFCDTNAMGEEEIWANKGFLVSDLSVQLEKKEIIKRVDFSQFFNNKTASYLIEESNEDIKESTNTNLLPYSMPEVENSPKNRNRFYDINTLLFLSSQLDLPFLNTNPTTNHFKWKFEKWEKGKPKDFTKQQLITTSLIDIYAPNLTVFPKTKLLLKAENAKTKLFKVSNEHELGKVSLKTLQKTYDAYLDSWLKYDQSVKSEAIDKFNLLLDFRNDKRIKKLRKFIHELTEKLSYIQSDSDIEISLRVKKELLEIEYEIAEQNKEYEELDKYSKYISFPTQTFTTISGAAASYLSQNPFFLALGLYPGFVDFIIHTTKQRNQKKYLWKSYLHDIKERSERLDRLKSIEKELETITKIR